MVCSLKNIKKMANQNNLKAWVRYDGTGTVVTAGPIFQANKPKVGNWKQINSSLCCNPSGTTTTTTTGGSVTPTAWVGLQSPTSLWNSCNNPATTWVLYTIVDATPLPPGTGLYTDAELTTLVYPSNTMFFSIDGYAYEVINGYTNPLGQGTPCASITTTTTTTAPTVYDFVGGYGVSSAGEACFAGMTQTFYSTTPYGSIGNGSVLYTDAGLTTPVKYAYVALTGLGIVFSCSSVVLSGKSPC
jgi:hypothetical protein